MEPSIKTASPAKADKNSYLKTLWKKCNRELLGLAVLTGTATVITALAAVGVIPSPYPAYVSIGVTIVGTLATAAFLKKSLLQPSP
jgi:hypothetical protein